jgi:hypothetical protein
LSIISHGKIYADYICKFPRCTMKYITREEAALCEALHIVRELTFKGTEAQRKDGLEKSKKPKVVKRIINTGAGMGRIRLTGYSHGRKKF